MQCRKESHQQLRKLPKMYSRLWRGAREKSPRSADGLRMGAVAVAVEVGR